MSSGVDIYGMLYAVAYGYEMACIEAERNGKSQPVREAFIVSWCIANHHRLVDQAARVSEKIVPAFGKPYVVAGNRCTVVEFMFDSWFHLLYNYAPNKNSTPIEPEWIEEVDRKANASIALIA